MTDHVLCRGQQCGSYKSRKTNLGVGAVLLLAFPTGEEVSLRPSCLGHLMLPDCFFRHGFPDLFQLITGHFLSKKAIKITSVQFHHHTHYSGKSQQDRMVYQMGIKTEKLSFPVSGSYLGPHDDPKYQQTTLHVANPIASSLPVHSGSSC